MSKKLLNETQVRRFMGLAGMNTNIVSNVIKEFAKTYEEEEEVQAMQETEYTQPVQEEEDPLPPAADDMPPVEDEPMEDPAGEPEMEITAEEADCLAGVLEKLLAAREGEADEAELEPEPEDLDAEAPAMEDELEEALSEVSLELSEDEIVQEVARRVTKRILLARKAQKQMNEALGK